MNAGVFLDLDFDAALARSKTEGRLLLVSLTKNDAADCVAMDRYVWSDARVAAWIAEHAFAIQIDVDRDAADAAKLEPRWEPSVVALEDGHKVDRVVGFQQPERIVSWLENLASGDTWLRALKREVAANPKIVFPRMDLAMALLHDGAFDESTAEYVWLWKHMDEYAPQMEEMKHAFFIDRMKVVFSVNPAAREAFVPLRDAAGAKLDAFVGTAFADWSTLNEVLGEPEKTLAWFDAQRERAKLDPELALTIEKALEPLLIAAGRWPEIAALHADPMGELRAQALQHQNVRAEMEMVAKASLPGAHRDAIAFTAIGMTEQLRETAWKLVRALRAAGRDDEANQIAEAAAAEDPSPEMAAAIAGQYTPLSPEQLVARVKEATS